MRGEESRRAGRLQGSEGWYEHFHELEEYMKEHPTSPTSGKIGSWLYQQRYKWRHGQLQEEYRASLEKLGVRFWGGEMVSGRIIREERERLSMTQMQLGVLLDMTAMNVSKLEHTELSGERVSEILEAMKEAEEMLESKMPDGQWQQRKDELTAYLEAHESSYPAKGSDLGRWVIQQRFLKAAGKMDARRIQELDRIGFLWSACSRKRTKQGSPRDAWEASFEEVKRFCQKHGALPETKDGKIGVWLYQQKYRCLHDRLPADRREKLEEIGVVFQ